MDHALSRRAGLAILAGGAVAACQTYGGPGQPPETPPTSTGPVSETPGVIAKTSDIPVGGGKVFPANGVVITQPAAGTFKCFSATCTHQGCTVGEVTGGTINCPCHDSKFSITDASVRAGPAKSPLPEKPITVQGGSISAA